MIGDLFKWCNQATADLKEHQDFVRREKTDVPADDTWGLNYHDNQITAIENVITAITELNNVTG